MADSHSFPSNETIEKVKILIVGLGPLPSSNMFIDAFHLLPIIIFAALLNSFSEEVMFRTSFISVSHEVVGKGQSI